MLGLSKIADYLLSNQLITEVKGLSANLEKVEIIRLKEISNAKIGDLAWVSAKFLNEKPEILNNFKGTALVLPENVDIPNSNYVSFFSKKPKLAFLSIANNFFTEEMKVKFPKIEEAAVSPEAKIGTNVILGSGCVIGSNVQIGNNVLIGPNTVVLNCDIDSNAKIGANCSIGFPGFGYEKDEDNRYHRFPHLGRVKIETNCEVGSNVCIDRGSLSDTILRSGCKVDNLVHVAHNVEIGEDSLVIAHAMLGGSSKIGKRSWIAPNSSLMNQIEIGDDAIVGLGAVVTKSVSNKQIVVGNPAREIRKNN